MIPIVSFFTGILYKALESKHYLLLKYLKRAMEKIVGILSCIFSKYGFFMSDMHTKVLRRKPKYQINAPSQTRVRQSVYSVMISFKYTQNTSLLKAQHNYCQKFSKEQDLKFIHRTSFEKLLVPIHHCINMHNFVL